MAFFASEIQTCVSVIGQLARTREASTLPRSTFVVTAAIGISSDSVCFFLLQASNGGFAGCISIKTLEQDMCVFFVLFFSIYMWWG
jgi:hypothetical protein